MKGFKIAFTRKKCAMLGFRRIRLVTPFTSRSTYLLGKIECARYILILSWKFHDVQSLLKSEVKETYRLLRILIIPALRVLTAKFSHFAFTTIVAHDAIAKYRHKSLNKFCGHSQNSFLNFLYILYKKIFKKSKKKERGKAPLVFTILVNILLFCGLFPCEQ